jgi:hypothetical protein
LRKGVRPSEVRPPVQALRLTLQDWIDQVQITRPGVPQSSVWLMSTAAATSAVDQHYRMAFDRASRFGHKGDSYR